jgi:hypothetical protein
MWKGEYMNREVRRKYINTLKKQGFSKSEIDSVLAMKQLTENDNQEYLSEGQKVKLNLESIMNHPDYKKNLDSNKLNYHNFVESHKDTIFTVEYDPKYMTNPYLVCLKEDDNNPRWLFHKLDLNVVIPKEPV